MWPGILAGSWRLSPSTYATPLLVAHGKGFFEAEGLAVEKPVIFRGWSQIVEAFLAGQVNVVHLLSPITIWARYGSKVPARVEAWNHTSGSALTAGNDIATIADPGGRTVAILIGSRSTLWCCNTCCVKAG